MDYVRNLRLGNSLFSQWVSDLQNSEQAPYVGKLGSSGVWAEEEHRTFQAQPVSEMLYFIRAEVSDADLGGDVFFPTGRM